MAWFCTWFSVAVAGTAVAVLAWPVAVVVTALVLGGAWGAMGTAYYLNEHPERQDPTQNRRQVLTMAVAGALLVTSAGGWVVLSAMTALQLALVATVTSPWAVAALVRAWRKARHGNTAPALARPDPADREAWLDLAISGCESQEEACGWFTTRELCQAWRQTFTAMDVPEDMRQALRVLALREALLDELERRDPEGFEAWLGSQVPAHVAPTAFFERSPDVRP